MAEYIDYQLLVDKVGEKLALEICELFAGRCIYFPRRREITAKHRRLIDDYNQNNLTYKALAAKYHYSESHVRFIINHYHYKKTPAQTKEEPQPSLFDL